MTPKDAAAEPAEDAPAEDDLVEVEMLCSMNGPEPGSHRMIGRTYKVASDEADALVAAGHAEKVETEDGE